MQDIGSLLSTLLEEFYTRLQKHSALLPREQPLVEVENKISVAIGMRRTGKTVLLLETIQQLLTTPTLKERILYLNFEDERLLPLSGKDFGKLVDTFYTLYPENHDQLCYLFFDEIQNVTDWPLVIRRLFDSKRVKIYLTGSSAKLLSTEIATSLRGRSYATEIWPFSFTEYLQIHSNAIQEQLYSKLKTHTRSKQTQDKLFGALSHYLFAGGFPETINLPDIQHDRILQDYVNVVLLRDIVERHQLTNLPLLKYLIKYLFSTVSSLFSVHKCFNDLKSQRFSLSKATVYEYLDYIEDAYLCFRVPLFTESIRQQQSNPKKIYAVDPGLARIYMLGKLDNLGRLFENLVYLDLRRQGCKIYYYLTQERYEIDFLAQYPDGKHKLLQVVVDTNDQETLTRETRALAAAEKELGLQGKLITLENYSSWINKDPSFI